MRRCRLCSIVLLLLIASAAPSQPAPATQPAVASTLPAGWQEIDQRLVFFTVQLAGVETSLDAVNKALKQAGYHQAVQKEQAQQYRKGNQLMDRNAGAPVGWKEFYGKTAEQFFYRPDIDISITRLKGNSLKDLKQSPGNQLNMPGPASLRPPQFEYIYRANADAQRHAEEEVAALGGKIDALVARRRQLEAEQAAIWTKIAFQALASRKLSAKPIYRFELKIDGDDDLSKQRQTAARAGAEFVRTVLRAIGDAQEIVSNDPSATFDAFQPAIGDAAARLSDQLVHSPKLALEVSDAETTLGRFSASADRLADVAKNIRDSCHGAADADKAGDDAQKQSLRAFLQQALFDCATNVSTSSELMLALSKEWKAEIDVEHPLAPATAPAALLNIQKTEQVAKSPEPVNLLGTMRGNTGRLEDGAIVLKEGDRISTDQAYVAPVRFTIVAMTDSTNLRIGYAADQIIFNSEGDPNQLRIDGGPANAHYQKGAGRLPVNEWVEIGLTVLPDSMRIDVNGKQRYVTDADFSHVNQPLSIFQAKNAVVRVKSVTAEPLPQSAAAAENPPVASRAASTPMDGYAAISKTVNTLSGWSIRKGDWTMTPEGHIRGEGDSALELDTPIPNNSQVSFRMNVVRGMRPRIYFDQVDRYLGNEGYTKVLYVHRKVEGEIGSPVPYKNGQELSVTMALSDGVMEVHVGDEVLRCSTKVVDKTHIELRAGDYWSKGTVEFWDFRVTPVKLSPMPVASAAPAPAPSAAAVESSATTRTIFDIDAADTSAATQAPAKTDEVGKPGGVLHGAAPEADAIARSIAEHYPDQLKDPKDVECLQFHDGIELRRKAGGPVTLPDSYSRTPVSGAAGELLLWGLYEDWPPGKYLIVFRVQAMSDVDGDKVCSLQVASGGNNMARHLPAAGEFVKGQWTNMPVIVSLRRTRTLEYRLWPQKHTIALDRVYIFRFKE